MSRIVRHAALAIDEGAAHSLRSRHEDRRNADLLAFARLKFEAIALPVSDIDAAKAFYLGLGYTVKAKKKNAPGRPTRVGPTGSPRNGCPADRHRVADMSNGDVEKDITPGQYQAIKNPASYPGADRDQ